MSVTASIVSAIVDSVVSAIVDTPPLNPNAPAYSMVARAFPADSKKGELFPPIRQPLLISGQTLNAAPGLQVRNQQNLIVMPNTVQASVPIRYQLDTMGNVWRIWILSSAELAAPDPQK